MGLLGSLFGGASSQDTAAASADAAFQSAMTAQNATTFGQSEEQLAAVKSGWDATFAAGPNQYGFSTAEDQLLQSTIENAGATATANTVGAEELRQQQLNGGATTGPAGASAALDEMARQTGAQNTATNLAEEKLAGYEQGEKEFNTSAAAEMDVAKEYTGASEASAEATNNAAKNTLGANQAVDTANANSLTAKLLGGLIGGSLAQGTQGLGNLMGNNSEGGAGAIGPAPSMGGTPSELFPSPGMGGLSGPVMNVLPALV